MLFTDRVEAGRRLGRRLATGSREPLGDVVVLGLPRGGVPVAYEVADALDAPLDVIVVRKLGVPFQPELAMGAIGEDGVRIENASVIRLAHITAGMLDEVAARERVELARRAELYRRGRPRVPVAGRTALLVDDGIATGSTVRAACQVARAHGAARVVVATPVAPPDTVAGLREVADDVVALESPREFHAIGQFYADFAQTSDAEVVRLLARRAQRPERDDEVALDADHARLGGRLTVPAGAPGIVVFAHGSGSSRHSPRNRFVASVLQRAGLGTLLFDLLTPDEERDRTNVFDIELLARRLVAATRWLRDEPEVAEADGARVGYFGASTGAAASLWAATEPDGAVDAIVSRGGRPDLAGPRLGRVRAPTLLIVGGNDTAVLALNHEALAQMHGETDLRVVPGATHLFEEPGTLESAANLARDWFVGHFS